MNKKILVKIREDFEDKNKPVFVADYNENVVVEVVENRYSEITSDSYSNVKITDSELIDLVCNAKEGELLLVRKNALIDVTDFYNKQAEAYNFSPSEDRIFAVHVSDIIY